MKKNIILSFLVILTFNISAYSQNNMLAKKEYKLTLHTSVKKTTSLFTRHNFHQKLNLTSLCNHVAQQRAFSFADRKLSFSKGIIQFNFAIDNLIDMNWNGSTLFISPKILTTPTDEIEPEAPLFTGIGFFFSL